MTMLLNALLQGVVLAAAVYVLLMQLPRLNAATRYAVWYLTLLAVAALPLRAIVGLSNSAATPASARLESNLPRPAYLPRALLPQVVTARSIGISPSEAGTSSRTWRPVQLAARPVTLGIIVIWITASAALLIRLAAGYGSLLRLKRRGRAAPASLVSRVELLSARALPGRRAALLVSDEVETPIVLGLFKPVILIPASLVGKIGWSDFDHMALHELAHLRRHDDWMNFLQKLLEAFLPIQPALFWIGRQINLVRETACDDCVIAETGHPKPYAESLARIAELAYRARIGLLASGVVGNPSQLYRRVQHLLDRNGNVMPRVRLAPLTVAGGVIAALLWMTLYAPQVVALEQPAANLPTARASVPLDVPAEPGTVAKSFTVSPGDKIEVDADQGNVNVGTWDKDLVQIVVKQKGPGLAEYLRHHSISMSKQEKEVRVKGTGDSWLSSHHPDLDVEYEIMIPIKLDGHVGTGVGNVEIARTGGSIDSSTGVGNIELAEIDGQMSSRTGAGNIDISESRAKVTARTGEGNIDVHAFSGPSIEAKTGMGNIDAELLNPIKDESMLHTGMGNISATIKATLAMNLEAATGMGRVKSQLRMGALNGGGPILSIKTGQGDIEIKKAN